MRWLTVGLVLVLMAGCEEKKRGTGGGSVGGPTPRSVESWTEKGDSTETDANEEEASPGAPPEEEPDAAPQPSGDVYEVGETSWSLGELHDLGPAAPISATGRGVLFVSLENRLYLAERKGRTFAELKAPAELFSKYGRGPAVSSTHAYWVARGGRLTRASLETGEPEFIAEGARGGARVSAEASAGRDVVSFIREEGGATVAYLWAAPAAASEAPELVRVSPEGSSATSVRLVSAPPHLRAVVLEGRTSMSPVHVRTVRVTKRRVALGGDEVVWVGPGSHALTEITTLDQPNGEAIAFVATAKNITTFGLAQLWIDDDAGQADAPQWRIYKNGLDPAPVTASHLCGGDWALFAVPSEERPHSPQELRLAPLENHAVGKEEVIARSRAFNDITVTAINDGAVVAWTADHRSWGLVLGCPDPSKSP